jgi:hypothetical protein
VNAIQEGIGYARQTGDAILTLLGMQNEKLDSLLNKPTPKPLTKFNVISEGQILTANIPQLKFPEFASIGTPAPGTYWRIDHWAYTEEEIGSHGVMALAIGDGMRLIGVVDVQDSSPNVAVGAGSDQALIGKSNPQNLIIPPGVPLLATSAPEVTNNQCILTVSYTAFGLSL